MGVNTGVKYIGKEAVYQDNILRTGLVWEKGETHSLPVTMAKEFLKHPSVFSEVPGFEYVSATPSPLGVDILQGKRVKNTEQLPSVAGTFAVLGDSRGELGFLFSSAEALYSIRAMGWAAWMNYYLGGPLTYVQTKRAAVSGELTSQWADGHAELMALDPPAAWVHITFPTNDVGNATSYAWLDGTKANLLKYITDHIAHGSRVTLEVAGGNGGWNTAQLAFAGHMNSWIETTAGALGLTVFDRLTSVTDGEMRPVSPYFFDNTHESVSGAHREGYFAAKLVGPHYARKNHFAVSPYRQAIYNPKMAGGSTLPPGWTAQGSGGTYSKVARTDGPPTEWARCVATAASEAQAVGFAQLINLVGARANSTAYNGLGVRILASDGHHYVVTTVGTSGASEPAWDAREGKTTTDGTVVWTRVADIIPGVSKLRLRAEAVVTSTGGGAYPRVTVSFTPGTGDIASIYAMALEPGHTIPSTLTLTNGPTPVVVSPDFVVPAGTTSLIVYVVASIANGATATLDMGTVMFEHIA